MQKIQTSTLMMALAIACTTGLSSCSSSDIEENSNLVYDNNGKAGVKSEFVISVPRKVVGTRQTDGATQSSGLVADFRGIDNICLIPFASEPSGTSTKYADIMRLSAVKALSSPGSVNYKVYSDQFVPVGTRNFLFYGRAIANAAEENITTMSDKFHYGVLNAKGLADDEFTNPNSILFSLEQINTSADAQAGDITGRNIIQLLNSIANTTVSGVAAPNDKWSTTNNANLFNLYKRFTSVTTSSTNTVAVILSRLYFSLKNFQSSDPAYKLVSAIRSKIEEACTSAPINGEPLSLSSSYTGYPGNIGLPDGAVRVRWNAGGLQGNSFVDVTAHYGKNYDLKITDYVYPAALWYYVNSPLKAAPSKKSDQYDAAGNWDGVINSVYNGSSNEVVAETQSIALTKQAEYGVGRIETRVKMGTGTFYDANGKEVDLGTGYTLKGILLGGQCSVGYDFTPVGLENMTIYDRVMASSNIVATPGYTTSANQTLALETSANQVVYAALELINGGKDFMGADGIIPAGGTFYLAVKLDPQEATNYQAGTLDKIIQQDYVTRLTVTINNSRTTVDRDGNGIPDVYIKDGDGNPIGVDTDGDGIVDPYDVNGDGTPDTFITDPAHGGPGWDTDGDGEVDIPVVPDEDGNYPDTPPIPDGLGNATNGIPDMTSPGIELGTSVNLEWKEGLILNPNI